MTSYPEFNVQCYYPGAANAALHGTTEANSFAASLDKVLEKQAGVMEALEKSTTKRAMLVESDKVTQSPMVWLNLNHASLIESPMGESQATVNVFVESGSGALPGAASLESISEKSDAMLRQVKP